MSVSRFPSTCPSCGSVAERKSYDIGSGPEYCCVECDWCWGAVGQDLHPYDAEQAADALAWWRSQQ